MTPGDDAECEVEQGKIVGRLFGPADQDRAEAVKPGMCALHHPAPCFGAGMALGPRLLAPTAQMQGEPELLSHSAWLVIVEALVEAQMLRATVGWCGPSHGNGLQRRAHQLMVVAIGSVDHSSQWDAAAVGQQRAFDPALASVSGIAPGFFPHPAAPCRSPRPGPARPNQ